MSASIRSSSLASAWLRRWAATRSSVILLTFWLRAACFFLALARVRCACVLGPVSVRRACLGVGRFLAWTYLELIRNTPLLVQIFFVYFVLAPMVDMGRMQSAVLTLVLFEGAYASEIVRAAILAIPRGQWEGALSLGMTRSSVYRLVILPQALQHALPSLTGQGVSLIKDSALVSTIALLDLTMQAQIIVAETFLAFEVWFTVAGIYLVFTLALSGLSKFLEKQETRRSHA